MEALGVFLAILIIYVPWLFASYWLSRRILPSSRGAAGLMARATVAIGLALFLPGVAGLFLYFWAFIASDNPVLAAVAYLVAVHWLTGPAAEFRSECLQVRGSWCARRSS